MSEVSQRVHSTRQGSSDSRFTSASVRLKGYCYLAFKEGLISESISLWLTSPKMDAKTLPLSTMAIHVMGVCTILERFLSKNQRTQRKYLNFEN